MMMAIAKNCLAGRFALHSLLGILLYVFIRPFTENFKQLPAVGEDFTKLAYLTGHHRDSVARVGALLELSVATLFRT